MIALLVSWSLLSAVSFVAGIATLIGLAVIVATLANPKVKRLVSATLVAIVLASLLGVLRAQDDDDFMMEDPCKKYTSSDWQWWVAGCMWP